MLRYFLTSAPSATVNGTDIFNKVMGIFVSLCQLGGGLWLVWGAIVLAGALKDKNGPQMQAGIWQIAGGAIIITAATLFNSFVL